MILKVWHCGAPEGEERCDPDKPGHLPSPNAKRRQNLYFCTAVDRAIRCDGPDCTKEMEFKDHHWDMIRAASKEGWFFKQDESLHLCIDHLTPGLIAWRDWNNPGWRGRLARGLSDKIMPADKAKAIALEERRLPLARTRKG